MLFELSKGDTTKGNHYQVMLQLLCADVVSNYATFVMLMNLNNDWRVYNMKIKILIFI